ncbi:MAG: twin-arginine translocase TatA/TatE family subunit [Elainellaceae cyanobacterium]
MLGLGWPEVAVVLVVALLIFGPKKIPEIGGAFGKTLKGFKDEIGGTPDDDLVDEYGEEEEP